MTTLGRRLIAVDPVLVRLGSALWRSLPALAVLALGSFAIGLGAVWLMRDALVIVPFAVAILLAPLVAVAVDRIHRELFENRSAVSFIRRLSVTAAGLIIPAAVATWSGIAAAVADASGSVLFQVVAVVTVIIAGVLAMVATIAVPIASMRADARIRSVATFALLATARRPLAPFAALTAAAAVTWLGLTAFSGLLAFVAPVLVVLAVACAWTTASRTNLELPTLTAAAPHPTRPEGAR